MALTISPPSPAASDGSTNSASTGPPQTPVLPGLPLETPLSKGSDSSSTTTSIANSANANAGGVKRTTKPSRRANTAERRATHNAVERQRRETLNGRFLDLAALLPNLSQIRRPSKSAIVNSSIAHINASRRHRLLAAQQLRALKNESDALRHEVNEWRMRAGIPAVEEPRRADSFAVILSGELEFEAGDMMDGGEDGDEDDELSGSPVPGGAYGGAQFAPGFAEEPEEYHLQIQQQQAQQQAEMLAQQHHQRQFAPQEVPQTIAIGRASQSPPHHPPHFGGSPMVASPAGAPPSFDPAFVYDQHQAHQLQQHQMMLQAQESDKWAYHQQLRARQAQQQGVW